MLVNVRHFLLDLGDSTFQLNIHRFKVIARFGLMHVVATNVCVWIRTLVIEYLKEITIYHKRNNDSLEDNVLSGRC